MLALERVIGCIIILMIIATTYLIRYDKELECIEYSAVVEVISVSYRDGTIRLASGEIRSVGQPHHKIMKGTKICVKWEDVNPNNKD